MKDATTTRHILVPEHSILSEEDVQTILNRYNITKKQMPAISLKDPAIQHLTPKPGDVIKILRPSPTQGTSIFYRVVTT